MIIPALLGSFFGIFLYFKNIKEQPVQEEGKIFGMVVPHHLLAAELIDQAFSEFSSEDPSTVILLSPNHFLAGRGNAISTLSDWKTPDGILEPDKELIQELSKERIVNISGGPFKEEHGIFNITPFIKKYFPSARVVPIIIKDHASKEECEKIAKAISSRSNGKTLVIASLDFSHYLPNRLARFHDAKAIEALSNLDLARADFVDVDSPKTLRVFINIMKDQGAGRFEMIANSNSGEIAGLELAQETTSYIIGYFKKGEKIKNGNITLSFFGSLSAANVSLEKNPFAGNERIFLGNDLAVADLRTEAGSSTVFLLRKGISFFDISRGAGPVSAGEGMEGFLEDKKIGHFGGSKGSVIEEANGKKIGLADLDGADAESSLKELRGLAEETEFLFVYADRVSSDNARSAIDAGADAVFGTGGDKIGAIDVYKGKPIFYDLGGLFLKKESAGMFAGVLISEEHIDYNIFFLKEAGDISSLTEEGENGTILRVLIGSPDIPEKMKEDILISKKIRVKI
jgi:AmmeMemoRadiSam system protein B